MPRGGEISFPFSVFFAVPLLSGPFYSLSLSLSPFSAEGGKEENEGENSQTMFFARLGSRENTQVYFGEVFFKKESHKILHAQLFRHIPRKKRTVYSQANKYLSISRRTAETDRKIREIYN